MGLKRTLKRHCERCGKPQLRFTPHNTVWLWHQCDNPIPGPHCPPSEHRLSDVLVEPGDAVAPDLLEASRLSSAALESEGYPGIAHDFETMRGLLRGVESLLRRSLRHGLLRAESEMMLLDIAAVLKNAAPQVPGNAGSGSDPALPAAGVVGDLPADGSLTPPQVADLLRTVELRAGYIIGACKDTREMRLEAEEIKRLLARASKGLREWWHAPTPLSAELDIATMVDRFLAWPLPDSVCADRCASMPSDKCSMQRIGTNLLTAVEARQMLEYVLQAAPQEERAVPTEIEAMEAEVQRVYREAVRQAIKDQRCSFSVFGQQPPSPASAKERGEEDLLPLLLKSGAQTDRALEQIREFAAEVLAWCEEAATNEGARKQRWLKRAELVSKLLNARADSKGDR